MRKHRKIYYSGGLISIILLPVFCILYLKSIDAFSTYGSIQLWIWDGKESKEAISKFLNSKTFTVVNLTGDLDSDITKLESAQKEIEQIISTKDSIKGIKFHFEKKAEYWAYVKVLDILRIANASNYLPYKNDIYFANPKVVTHTPKVSKEKIEPIICISGILQKEYFEGQKNKLEAQRNKLTYQKVIDFSKKYYLPIIFYILMVFFSLRRLCGEKNAL